MNDDFLSKFRQAPSPEFAQSLYTKLVQGTKARQPLSRNPTVRRIALVLAALCLAFVLTLAVSPAARAAVSNILATITLRGMIVWVNDDMPSVRGEGESYGELWSPATPSEVVANYPFFAKLPTWIPSSYVLQERAALYYVTAWQNIPPEAALFEWKNDRGGTIQLTIRKASCPNGPTYDSGAARSDCLLRMYIYVSLENQPEVIAVNGEPALLLHDYLMLADLSDPVQKWNPSRGKYDNRDPEALSLTWESDGRTFQIFTKSPAISEKQLIRLAESIP